jgi:hypothetical protein
LETGKYKDVGFGVNIYEEDEYGVLCDGEKEMVVVLNAQGWA